MVSNFKRKHGGCVVMAWILVFIIPAFAGAFSPGDGPAWTAAFAGREMPPHRIGPLSFWRNPKIIEEYKITDEQVSQFKEIDFTFRERNLELTAQLDSTQLQMEKAFSAPPVNKAAVIGLAQKIADLQGRLFVQNTEFKLTVEELLTVDQLKKLKSELPPFPPMDAGSFSHERRFPETERHP
jgi:Spy/CpxP family protein refolding chaperone